MDHETHPNPNEIFPQRGELGVPGGTAKAKAVIALVTSAAAVVALTTLLALTIVCTALNITVSTADIQVRLENWDESPITWNLTRYENSRHQPQPVLQTGVLTQKVSILKLESLAPDTWYELWFYEQADAPQRTPVSRYRFRTGPGTAPLDTTPPATTPAETTPPETTPVETTPPETTPVETTPPETTPPETTPLETTPPETTPPDTTPPETTPAETTPPETTPPETTPVETTPPETTPPETTPAQTTPPETTPGIPDPVAPTANTPVLERYDSPMLDNSGYTVSFSFSLNDGIPNQILITDVVTAYSNFGLEAGNQGFTEQTQTTVTQTYTPADIVIDTAANTATVTYFAADPYTGHSITAALDYTLIDAQGNAAGSGTVSGDAYTIQPSYLYGLETSSNTTWSTTVNTDTVDVVLTIRDYQKGTLDYEIHTLNLYVDYQAADGATTAHYTLAELINPPALPVENGGVFTYSFTIPLNPEGWEQAPLVIYLSMDAAGDCLLNGEAMNISSETFAYTQVYTVDTYSADAPSLAFSGAFLTQLTQMLGLELGSVELVDNQTGMFGSSLDNLLPGATVDVYVYFVGTVANEALLSGDITFSADVPVEVPAQWQLTAGEVDPVFIFRFTMPERDVLSSDIAIQDFVIEITGPETGI